MLHGRGERLEVGVPDPGHVAAVGVAVVERGEEAGTAPGLEEGGDRRVEPGRVLHEHQAQRLPVHLDGLEAAERGGEVRERTDRLGEPDREGPRRGEGGERVVHVVQAGDGHTDLVVHAGEDAADHDLAPPRAEDDLRRRDVARRPREVARRARPHADVREHDALVAERRAAARAARRVADRLRHVPADRVVVDAEVRDVRVLADRQARDERVVGVQHERGLRGEPGERVADAPREGVELEVAVHLVAEEVRDDDGARPDAPDDSRERGLVDLEEPEVAARLAGPGRVGEERGGDAAVEVGARAVVDRRPAGRARDVGEHPRGRRLPVRAAHAHDAMRQLARERADEVGVERERDEPGERGGAAAHDAQALARELARGVGDDRERVRHEPERSGAKRRRA